MDTSFQKMLDNLFADINSRLAFKLENIPSSRLDFHLERINKFIDKLELYSSNDDLSSSFKVQIREYLLKLEIRANKLCSLLDQYQSKHENKKVEQCKQLEIINEKMPKFNGKSHQMRVYLTAINDLIMSNPSLNDRAKYRAIFFSLDNDDDQKLLDRWIDPNEPNLTLAINLLTEKYPTIID